MASNNADVETRLSKAKSPRGRMSLRDEEKEHA
jgi:hypothetical protein